MSPCCKADIKFTNGAKEWDIKPFGIINVEDIGMPIWTICSKCRKTIPPKASFIVEYKSRVEGFNGNLK